MNFGVPSLVLMFILGVMLFGPSKLPAISRAIGKVFKVTKGLRKWL